MAFHKRDSGTNAPPRIIRYNRMKNGRVIYWLELYEINSKYLGKL